jgi:hypothetical protein
MRAVSSFRRLRVRVHGPIRYGVPLDNECARSGWSKVVQTCRVSRVVRCLTRSQEMLRCTRVKLVPADTKQSESDDKVKV